MLPNDISTCDGEIESGKGVNGGGDRDDVSVMSENVIMTAVMMKLL